MVVPTARCARRPWPCTDPAFPVPAGSPGRADTQGGRRRRWLLSPGAGPLYTHPSPAGLGSARFYAPSDETQGLGACPGAQPSRTQREAGLGPMGLRLARQPRALRPAEGPGPSRVHTGLWPLAGPSRLSVCPGGRHLWPPAWQSPGPVLSRGEGHACGTSVSPEPHLRVGGCWGGRAAPPLPLPRSF